VSRTHQGVSVSEQFVHALRDIRGLDSAAELPSSSHSWLIALIVVVVAAILWALLVHLRERRRTWRHEVGRRLKALSVGLEQDDPKHTAAELSALLRVAAIARFGRHCCAGLSGERWLQWLALHAPDGFDWPLRGRLLLRLPYAPAAGAQDRAALATLLQAACRWVEAGDGRVSASRRAHGEDR